MSAPVGVVQSLPDGFAIVQKTIWTNSETETTYVLMTKAPNGTLSRRVGSVTDLGNREFKPFNDTTYSAVQVMVDSGWRVV